eukprot:CAMPEP_0116894132 /NCGR_PEP_ID=MMETSP0467-20121206/3981_1 /TAXON_ID=283647 /ORGANISM="Mesodinium pulex, Strain SPMC105" /LENGTH=102 /DNA_ID=CAMNT_0004564207 /DNA_START=867 /DNA_END=1175 /DNA_ORIENTATION=+
MASINSAEKLSSMKKPLCNDLNKSSELCESINLTVNMKNNLQLKENKSEVCMKDFWQRLMNIIKGKLEHNNTAVTITVLEGYPSRLMTEERNFTNACSSILN